MTDNPNYIDPTHPRIRALELAVASATPLEAADDVVERSQKYHAFLLAGVKGRWVSDEEIEALRPADGGKP